MRTAFLAAGAATLSLVLIAPGAALAACDTTYSGASGDWQTGANWSTGSMPNGTQEACIPTGKTVTIVENGVPTAKNVVITAGATLQMRTQPGNSNTQASFGGVDNSGTLAFVDPANPETNDNNSLTIATGGKLINRSGGIVRVGQSATTYTNIYGSVDNLAGGQFLIKSQLRNYGVDGPNTFANAGTMSVDAGVALSFNSGWATTIQQTAGTFTNNGSVTSFQAANVFDVSGGSFTVNPVIIRQGQLKLTGGTGTVAVQWGAASLISDVASGWTIRIEDRGSDVVRLKIPAGTTRTNAGTIAFAKDPAPGTDARVASSIDILAGAKLVNAGTIRADADAGDAVNNDQRIFVESLAPNQTTYKDPTAFVQNGTLQVSHNMTLPPFTQNSGTTTVDPGKTLTAGNQFAAGDPGITLAGGTLTGSGRVQATTVRNTGGVVAPTPGAATNLRLSFGFLFDPGQVQGGDYVQTAGGTLRTRLAATGGGLTVGGETKIAGTLDVAPALGFTPAAGQTYLLVRHEPTYDPHFRTGTFGTVVGSYAPIYELDGVDVTAAGGTSSFTVEDNPGVREGQIANFVVKRTTGTGTATVHWALNENGSAAASNADYGYTTVSGQRPDRPQNGDLTFAAGETQKTIAIQTYGDGTPEPDETFGIRLSHPTNVRVDRADALGTILNDDYDFQSVAPNVLPNSGPITVTLRGGGLTSRMTAKLRYSSDPNNPINPVSFTPSDDGLTAKVVFDTTGLKADGNWFVQLYTFSDTNFAYRAVTVENSTEGAKPYVQGVVAPKARGGVTSYDYLHYGNVGRGVSRYAFLRLSGYPTGADVKVDHLPAGASYTLLDGVAGRTVLVSLGKIAGGANDYIRVGYTPTTTISGHTMLGLQASMSFGDAIPALTDGRTFLSATPVAPGAGELFASNMAFSPAGSLTLRYSETGATGGGPAITHTGTRWTFRGDITDPLAPEPKAARAAIGDPTGGLLSVDFGGGEFKITGPIIELEGAYEISIEKRRLTECLKAKGLIDQQDYDDLIRFADGAVVLKGLTTAADKAGLGYGDHLSVMNAVMSGAWEKRVLGGTIGIVDQIANPKWGFDLLQNDEYQMLWLAQLCNEKDTIPEPDYDEKGNYKPSKYIKELLQSFDPNEKYGTQGGGSMHAVRSDRPLDYTVGFQNLPTASAAAQTVTVTDTLDPAKVDVSTFSLGPIAFAGRLLSPPAGVTTWTKTVDLRPGKDMLVKVEAGLTGSTVKWTFTTLDPLTLAKTTDVTAGFLPPSGEGSVAYSVAPKAGIATGTAIAGGASIVFDTNAPIATNVWSNLIDDVAPTGSVTSIKRACDSVTASWSGSDAASGVSSYDVWVSVDGGAYNPFRINTTDTSAAYPASTGHTYAFDVQVRDFAGNLQSANRADAVSGSVDCTPVIVQPGGGGQQPPTTKPPVVTPKPWVKLGKLPSKLKKNALAVPVICPATETAGCKGKLTLTTVVKKGKKKVTTTLGSASFTVKAGKTGTVSVKLSKAALKLLKKGSLKVSLAAVAADKRTTTASGKLAKVKR